MDKEKVKVEPKQELRNCLQCDFSTINLANLKTHIRKAHDKIKANPRPKKKACPKCEYKAADTRDVERHVKAIHDKVKDHECPICDKFFSQKVHLNVHIKTVHWMGTSKDKLPKEVKPCPQCDYLAPSNTALKYHIKSIHEMSRDQKCPKCDYRGIYAKDVLTHVKVSKV